MLILVKPFGRCPFANSDFPAENPRTQTRNVPYTNTLAAILQKTTINHKMKIHDIFGIEHTSNLSIPKSERIETILN